MAKTKLCFDATHDVDNVGAWVRAGTDGDKIASQTLASEEWLNVASILHDKTGTPIDAANPLPVEVTDLTIDVNLDGVYNGTTNTDPDNIGAIFHSRATTPGDAEQGFRSTGATPTSDALTGTTIHALDVNSFGMAWDGTGWDRVKKDATSEGLLVHLAEQSVNIDINLNDSTGTAIGSINSALKVDDTANTACDFNATSVDNTVGGIDLRATDLASRKYLFLYNNGNETVYVGESGVTTATGFPLDPCSYLMLRAGASCDLHAIAPSATAQDIRIAELS